MVWSPLARTGKFFEVPLGRALVFPLLVASAMSIGSMAVNDKLFWKPPATLDAEYRAAAAEKDGVMERGGAPPVFLNPISRGLPGGMRGPEDVATS